MTGDNEYVEEMVEMKEMERPLLKWFTNKGCWSFEY